MHAKRIFIFGFLVFPCFGAVGQTRVPDATTLTTAQAQTIEERVFDISRDGKTIGAEKVIIEKIDDTTIVKFETHISVVVMFIEAYRYVHSAVETWTGGKFVSYKTVTDDNGKHFNVVAVAKDDHVLLDANGTHTKLPGNLTFASLWNRDFVGRTILLHPDSGAEMPVEVKDLGDEQIEFKGQNIKAHHYRISGELNRDVWFAGDQLLRMKFYGSDHSTIMSELTEDKSN